MTQINVFQDVIARLDLSLPWLLPTLEAVEQTVPSTTRLTICAVLMVGFALLRLRHTASAQLQRAVL